MRKTAAEYRPNHGERMITCDKCKKTGGTLVNAGLNEENRKIYRHQYCSTVKHTPNRKRRRGH